MDHQRRIHRGVFQDPRGDHVLGALENFLGGLEHELHGAVDFLLMGFQQRCRAQEHGGVHVVAAGMHAAVVRGEGKACLLGHGQGIHIRPEEKHLPGFLPADGDGEPRFAAVQGLQAQLLQFGADEGQGVVQTEFGFRIPVQLPAGTDNPIPAALGLGNEFLGIHKIRLL